MVDVVIVNWNSGSYLYKCVQSIIATDIDNLISNIFIVDNNSSDNSLETVPVDDKIVFVKNDKNLGFAKACNQGFKLSTSSYVLLLNPDTQLLAATIKDCIAFMNQTKEIDILGCQLLRDDGTVGYSCSRFPSPKGIFFDATGLSKIAPSIFKPGIIMTDWDHKESRFVDQLMGAFMLMHRTIFERIGYFDERFFVYFEEVDFSKRLAQAGGKSFFNANIKAIHSGEGTTSSVKAFRLFLNLRSRLLYAKKHLSFAGYTIVWMCTYLIEPFSRTFFLLIKGKFREIGQVFKGYKWLAKGASPADK